MKKSYETSWTQPKGKMYIHYGCKVIMANNFPNLGKERDMQIHDAQKFPQWGYT